MVVDSGDLLGLQSQLSWAGGSLCAARVAGLTLMRTTRPWWEVSVSDDAVERRWRVLLASLVREERLGRKSVRLTEPGLVTWESFRGRLPLSALLELVREDAAVTQPFLFDLEGDGSSELLDNDKAEKMLQAALDAPKEESSEAYIQRVASSLGMEQRLAASELRSLQPHHRALEIPGGAGRVAHHAALRQPHLSFQDIFTVVCQNTDDMAFAGLVAVEHRAGKEWCSRLRLDPGLEWAREHSSEFTHVLGVRKEKGGFFEREQLHEWFPASEIVLI
jgi:hypothetical protein